MNFGQQLFNALSLGAIYALIALGYTMVFGILKLINLAHGDIMMVGAYGGFIMVNVYGQNILVAIIVAVIVSGITGLLVEKIAYRPILNGKKAGLVVSAIGSSIVIQYTMMIIFKAKPRAYAMDYKNEFIEFMGVHISKTKVLILVISIVFMGILTWFLKYHSMGLAMRAVSDKEMAAELCGIYKEKSITHAFLIGCSLAGVAGVIYGSLYMIHPLMGGMPGLKAFCAAVLGGVGNIPGAVVGGLLLGFIETFSTAFFNASFKDILTFLIMLLVLLFLPSGIMGKKKGGKRV